MNEKLLPCPFCGKEVLLYEKYVKTGMGTTLSTEYVIRCNKCLIETKAFKTTSSAVKFWNKRA